MRPIRVLITDDEPAARRSIRALLAPCADVRVVGECVTAQETVRAILDGQPDLLFLDVQLPGASGLEVLARVPPQSMPVVVFVTAYDEYAVSAFDHHAADYLLKPYSDSRFRTALERARLRLRERGLEELRGRLLELAADAGQVAPGEAERPAPAATASRSPHTRRLAVRTGDRVTILPAGEVEWVEATADYVRLHAAGRVHLLRSTMSALERRLDPSRFVRVHRSTIVNIDFVREIRGSTDADYLAVLRDGTTRRVSGRGRELLSRLLGERI